MGAVQRLVARLVNLAIGVRLPLRPRGPLACARGPVTMLHQRPSCHFIGQFNSKKRKHGWRNISEHTHRMKQT